MGVLVMPSAAVLSVKRGSSLRLLLMRSLFYLERLGGRTESSA